LGQFLVWTKLQNFISYEHCCGIMYDNGTRLGKKCFQLDASAETSFYPKVKNKKQGKKKKEKKREKMIR